MAMGGKSLGRQQRYEAGGNLYTSIDHGFVLGIQTIHSPNNALCLPCLGNHLFEGLLSIDYVKPT